MLVKAEIRATVHHPSCTRDQPSAIHHSVIYLLHSRSADLPDYWARVLLDRAVGARPNVLQLTRLLPAGPYRGPYLSPGPSRLVATIHSAQSLSTSIRTITACMRGRMASVG